MHVHGSVGAAATALGYTPSAVSQQIAKLERETRTTLLERQGRGVALTEAAHLLAATAQELMAIVEQAEMALEEQRGGRTGRLTMAAFPTAARGLLPQVLAELAAGHPALEPGWWRSTRICRWTWSPRAWSTWRWRTTGTSRRCPPRGAWSGP